MDYTTISVKDARNNLSELIERAALAKEAFLVTKFGKPKALIVAADTIRQKTKDKTAILEKTVGLWSKRKDIKDSASWVKGIRSQESSRHEKVFS